MLCVCVCSSARALIHTHFFKNLKPTIPVKEVLWGLHEPLPTFFLPILLTGIGGAGGEVWGERPENSFFFHSMKSDNANLTFTTESQSENHHSMVMAVFFFLFI